MKGIVFNSLAEVKRYVEDMIRNGKGDTLCGTDTRIIKYTGGIKVSDFYRINFVEAEKTCSNIEAPNPQVLYIVV